MVSDAMIRCPVSIHAPAWGATATGVGRCKPAAFQSTRPRGARHFCRALNRAGRRFNPRARVGRDSRRSIPCAVIVFQSTRPRGARRAASAALHADGVSIHAPAWGATRADAWTDTWLSVSIHAPAWGATAAWNAAEDAAWFQSTRPRGARHRRSRQAVEVAVSIHAPAWGATRDSAMEVITMTEFQSTRPRGARRQDQTGRPHAQGFNPRARVGRDHHRPADRDPKRVSIHAPAWGATRGPQSRCCSCKVSIHAPAWGATRSATATSAPIGFNPRARVGRDLLMPLAGASKQVSIHAPAWGATKTPSQVLKRNKGFNPRARVGRDFYIHAVE